MHSSTAVPEWWSNEAKTPIWRRQINKRISCFRLRWLFRAAQRGLGRICFGGPLLSRPWGWVGLCDCSFGGHQVLLSSTESLGGVPNKSLGLALVVTNGSSREGNRIINPHSRIPKSTNKQTIGLISCEPPRGDSSAIRNFSFPCPWTTAGPHRERISNSYMVGPSDSQCSATLAKDPVS